MKKIGGVIVSDLNHTNYGSALQAYATMKVIQGFGYDLTFIKYKKKRSILEIIKILPGWLLSGGFSQVSRYIKTKYKLKSDSIYASNIQKRKDAINTFKKREFVPYFKEYIGYKALCEGSLEYDVIFVGSDQVWRPYGYYSNYWNLNFVHESIPTFSYSSSYGVSSIPWFQKTGTKKYLERIDLVSVREIRAKEIVETISDQKAKVVADPTLLLSREQWLSFANKSERNISEPYIFCYFLGPRRDIRDYAIQLAKNTGCKIVINPHMEQYRKADENIGDYIFYDVNPYDFVNLLSKATYVCTDSFHGTVFSLLMHKQFLSFYRELGPSTNSRIDSLLKIFGLESRLFNNKFNDFNIIKNFINYDLVDEKLKEYRSESLDFFEKALRMSNKQ